MILVETEQRYWQRSEISPEKHGQLILEKGTQILQRGKDSLVNKRWVLEDWTPIWQEINPNIILTLYTKINSKWTTDLNVK